MATTMGMMEVVSTPVRRQRSPSSTASSPIDQHLEIAVDEAEKWFVSGDFRQALKQANRCLTFAASAPISPIYSDDDRVETSLSFPFIDQAMFLRIDLQAAADLTDRAAAIALQSWYELFQQASGSERARGYPYLEPFYQAYSNSPHRACSLELALVVAQFCSVTKHAPAAVELACVTLYHLFAADEVVLREQHETAHELLLLLFATLPYAGKAEAVSQSLSRFFEPTWPSSHFHYDFNDLDTPHKSSVRAAIRFIDNPPIHWPEKMSLHECRKELEAIAEEALDGSFDEQDLAAVVPMSSSRLSSLPTLGWDGSGEQWLRRFLYLARVSIVEPLVWSEDRWENRGKAAVALWTCWMAWRRRRGVYRGSKYAVYLLLKPVREIVEALVPKRR